MRVAVVCHARAAACDAFFFFNDTATTEIYTLSLHDALPIFLESLRLQAETDRNFRCCAPTAIRASCPVPAWHRSEEHTPELQSRLHLVCRLLLEKKKNSTPTNS